MARVRIENLTYYYPETEKPALENINLNINTGEFVVLVGSSGSGKSSLLRCIAGIIPNFYQGQLMGQVLIEEINLNKLTPREIANKIAILFQEPEHQLIKHRVENEIAFSLENLGIDRQDMKQRVAEVSTTLNLVPYLDANISELSGGLKQKIALASILVRQPEILLLDEPLSQLDPVAAADLLNVIRVLHEELGITVIMTEHRLENLLSIAKRVVVMENGKVLYDGTVKGYPRWAKANNYQLIPNIPKLFAEANFLNVPMNVQEGKNLLANFILPSSLNINPPLPYKPKEDSPKPLINFKNVSYQYPNNLVGVKNVTLNFKKGETTAIIGHNGAGKSTLLKLTAGILKPTKGRINTRKCGYLPQNPDDFLFLPTVVEELTYNLETQDKRARVDELLEIFNLSLYKNYNPRDLSFGQKQLVVLAAVLIHEPPVICLDEPTRGLDYRVKKELGDIFKAIKKTGKTIIIVSNDIEFIAEYSDNIIIMSKGEIVATDNKYDILTKATFYAPQVNRLFKNINDNILTYQEATDFLKLHQQSQTQGARG